MDPLVNAREVRTHLQDPEWVIVDCRHDLANPEHGPSVYAQGHIPGAYFLHLDRDLSGPVRRADGSFRGRHPLPARDVLAKRLGDLGVGPDTMLIAYDEADNMYASRLWWLALWLGHPRVAVLEGGLKAWRDSGYELSTVVPAPRPVQTLVPRTPLMQTVDPDTLLGALGTDQYRIIDARAPERFRGEVEPLDAKAGHIPGARNRPFRLNLAGDGRFKSSDVLRREFQTLLNGFESKQAVHQCGSGVSACHNVLAMAVAGMEPGMLYPGSWSEWSADPARPVATGGAT
jgi:thiosulfate/3-mercaptopyruvate sulfurtransferase